MPCPTCGQELTTAGCLNPECVESRRKWGCVENTATGSSRDSAAVERERIVKIVKRWMEQDMGESRLALTPFQVCDEILRRIG